MKKLCRKSIMLVFSLAAFVVLLSRCMNKAEATVDFRGAAYAGAASCRQCHQAIYDSSVNNAHSKATSAALTKNIKGNFSNEKDSFSFNNVTKMVMEKRDDGYYQVIYQNGKENGAYKLDVLFGFKYAQTSGYWVDDKLYELPLSHYSSVNAWGTSPGFPNDFVKLGRTISTDCLDCHSSAIKTHPRAPGSAVQVFEKETLMFGIDCERCHGPAGDHVNYHVQHPAQKAAAFMVRNTALTQQQRLDACAVCHSGNDNPKIKSRFNFKMGDTLAFFFLPKFKQIEEEIDVHGNQFSLLQKSLCFIKSTNMTCGNCHAAHQNASPDVAVYSQKCMSCHQPEKDDFCPKYASLGESIKSNCIDCHMPKQPSTAIKFQLSGSKEFSAYLLRTHRIAKYGL